MKLVVVAPLLALGALASARAAREQAKDQATALTEDAPYAPSPLAAPFVCLGYRELGADLMFVRMVGYFGSQTNTASGIAALAEATAALDPRFRRVFEFGAIAMTAARTGVDNAIKKRAIKLLEIAAKQFPDSWKFPNLAGQIYLVDLETKDPVERRAWDRQGAVLLESSARKPNAPSEAGVQAAVLQSKVGQRQHAIDSLRELLLVTNDAGARAQLLAKLAELSHTDSAELAAELAAERKRFEHEWTRDRPSITPSLYIRIGKHAPPGFDLDELALGGRISLDPDSFERLEPLDDLPPGPAPAPAHPAP